MRPLVLGSVVMVWAAAVVMAQDEGPPVLPGEVAPAEPEAREVMALRRPPALEIASAYGFEDWPQIERVDFTFNVEAAERTVRRQWTWWTKENRVTRRIEGREPVSFNVVEGSIMLPVGIDLTGEQVDAHKQFVNDSYWFLFPFQIVWSNPQVTQRGEAALPIGEGTAHKVTVQYGGDGGYTPGDAYDLYLDEDHRIVQWVFRRGGGEKGSPMTWETHRSLGPIAVSLDHWSPDRKTHLFFSDVSVVVADDDGQTATHTPAPIEDD